MHIQSHDTFKSTDLNWDRFITTAIIEVKRGENTFTSTGILINDQTLLTAAHSIDCADEIKVILTHDYNFITESFQVDRCYIHPEYSPRHSLYENDIAVLFLTQSINKDLIYDSLPIKAQLRADSVLERIGFGGRANKNRRTWTNPTYIETSFSKKTFILSDRYSFIGDSGGPIYVNDRGERKLIGIHSTREAGNKTYVVNLAQYRDWIEGIIGLNAA